MHFLIESINVYFPGNYDTIEKILVYLNTHPHATFTNLIEDLELTNINYNISVAKIIFLKHVYDKNEKNYYTIEEFRDNFFSKSYIHQRIFMSCYKFMNLFIKTIGEFPDESFSFESRINLVEIVLRRSLDKLSAYQCETIVKMCKYELKRNHSIRDFDGFHFRLNLF